MTRRRRHSERANTFILTACVVAAYAAIVWRDARLPLAVVAVIAIVYGARVVAIDERDERRARIGEGAPAPKRHSA
jgi:Flp pilus assembly protein TadB